MYELPTFAYFGITSLVLGAFYLSLAIIGYIGSWVNYFINDEVWKGQNFFTDWICNFYAPKGGWEYNPKYNLSTCNSEWRWIRKNSEGTVVETQDRINGVDEMPIVITFGILVSMPLIAFFVLTFWEFFSIITTLYIVLLLARMMKRQSKMLNKHIENKEAHK